MLSVTKKPNAIALGSPHGQSHPNLGIDPHVKITS